MTIQKPDLKLDPDGEPMGAQLLEMWIDRDQRLRPKAAARINLVDLIAEILAVDSRERAGKAPVIRNECAIQIKCIHDGYGS